MHCPPLMLLRRTLGLSAVLISLPVLAMADPPPAAPPAGAGTPADEARGLVEPDPTTGSDVALAIPRAVLTIPRAALQVVSWPVVGAIRLEDEYHVLSWLEDLVYNDARTAAVIPYGAIDSHFGPSVGMVAFHDDAFGHEEKLHLSARFGGREKQAYELSFAAGHTTSVGAMVNTKLEWIGSGAAGVTSRRLGCCGSGRFTLNFRGRGLPAVVATRLLTRVSTSGSTGWLKRSSSVVFGVRPVAPL